VNDYGRHKARWEDIRQKRSLEKFDAGVIPERWIDGAEDVEGKNGEICFQSWKNHRKKRLRAPLDDTLEGISKKQHDGGCDDNHTGTSGVFVNSLGKKQIEHGPTKVEKGEGKISKNRLGQRARKAKAMAMEAISRGEKWDSSLNWREKKLESNYSNTYLKISMEENAKSKRRKTTSGLDPSFGSVSASDVANMGKRWKETGKAHPSWAARELAKQHALKIGGIPLGKKIIF